MHEHVEDKFNNASKGFVSIYETWAIVTEELII